MAKNYYHYLLKTEPSEYSFADLQNDRSTVWDGVTNPAAVKNLREMPKGAKLVIYHTGAEKQAVGLATALSIAAVDPRNPRVEIKAGRSLAKPITLAELKSNDLFKDSPLIRQGRLSVVPLTAAQYAFIAEP
jgi:predicted RNA-binding protein with PUA-like domain